MLSAIREYRIAQRMTQCDLARKMNITRRSIIRWEKGQHKPTMRKRQLLAELMGCKAEDIFQD